MLLNINEEHTFIPLVELKQGEKPFKAVYLINADIKLVVSVIVTKVNKSEEIEVFQTTIGYYNSTKKFSVGFFHQTVADDKSLSLIISTTRRHLMRTWNSLILTHVRDYTMKGIFLQDPEYVRTDPGDKARA